MVLLPAALLTGMPAELLEAVIAHELAHIRRLDLWVNLGQRVVETLLFYHPAVWWLSARVRREREVCCDEAAAGATERETCARAWSTSPATPWACRAPARRDSFSPLAAAPICCTGCGICWARPPTARGRAGPQARWR